MLVPCTPFVAVLISNTKLISVEMDRVYSRYQEPCGGLRRTPVVAQLLESRGSNPD